MPRFETLTLTVDPDGVAVLTVNRPDKLNALNRQVMRELNAALDAVESDAAIRAVVLTGAGPKAFVAGADISELAGLDTSTGEEFSRYGQTVFDRIESSAKVFVAYVNGFALGGGCELALACHLRVAADNAVMGLPEVTLGTIPGYGGTQRLMHVVGKGRALELMLTAVPVKAEAALGMGLVNRVVPAAEGLEAAKAMARQITTRGPLAVAAAIQAVRAGLNDADAGYEAEAEAFGRLCGTADFAEGTAAFLAKRPPSFTGS